jgi:hypothetical protein
MRSARVAQLVEHSPCKRAVGGSSPPAGLLPLPSPRTPKEQGERSERRVIAALLTAGYEVLVAPYGENRRYDCVLDLGDRFVRVQVKTARLVAGKSALVAATASLAGLGTRRHRVAYRGQVDVFALYSPDLDRVYLLPVDECPGAEVRLRLAPARNGQRARSRLASDYELRSGAGRTD